MPVSEALFQQVAIADPEGNWELHRGRLREKPTMSAEHNHVLDELDYLLGEQLDRHIYRIRANLGHVARSDESHFVPDLYVVEARRVNEARRRGDPVETYRDPLPLVVEIWSPSTGQYDVDDKLPEYMRRGDAEIWRLHPHERTLRGWRRRPDGTYEEFLLAHGIVEPVALPRVRIDLDALFAPPD
jgi:Uma2 family endonuclease